jgi:hypothetical protein
VHVRGRRLYGTSQRVSDLKTRRTKGSGYLLLSLPLAALATLAFVAGACVPAGNSTPSDGAVSTTPSPTASAKVKQAPNILRAVFTDDFERPAPATDGSSADSAKGDSVKSASPALGPNWYQSQTDVWHIENGRLCGQNAKNHGVWLQKPIPINARIEFDAISDGPEGDLKAEVWGDGQSSATSVSYTNATSYLTIFGGWHNTENVLARINEHGADRKEIKIEKNADDVRQRPVTGGQPYHFKIERTDGKTVRWSVDNVEYLTFPDSAPLAGIGHDHFGFNDWEVKVCFDNVKVTPL